MSKIKPRLIVYRSDRNLKTPKTCIKNRLYLSNTRFPQGRESLPCMKKVYKAQVIKYVRNADCNSLCMFHSRHLTPLIYHLLFLNPYLTGMSVTSLLEEQKLSKDEEQKFVRRLFNRQKKLQQLILMLEPPSLDRNILKASMQIKHLKHFEVSNYNSSLGDLAILKSFLENLHKRKPWMATESQKINVEWNIEEDERNDDFVQFCARLLELQDLLKKTGTQLGLTLNIQEEVEMDKDSWILLGNTIKGMENGTEIKFYGRCNGTMVKDLKELKGLRSLNFELENEERFEEELLPVLSENFERLGKSLTHFTMHLRRFDCRNSVMLNWIQNLQGLSRLKYLNLSDDVCGLNDEFFIQLSDSIKLMPNLRNLKIQLLPRSDVPSTFTMGSIQQLLTTIGGLIKLEVLSFGLINYYNKPLDIGGEPLCGPLMNLKNLKVLTYCLSAVKAGNNEMAKLLTVLPELRQIEELTLKFSPYENLEERSVKLLFKLIGELKRLRKVDLDFRCLKIKNESLDIFFGVLTKLRFLETVLVSIDVAVRFHRLEKDLKKRCNQIQIERNLHIQVVLRVIKSCFLKTNPIEFF